MSKKYVRTNDFNGLDYKVIAEIMTNDGHEMNHSSVRNYITRGFCKIVKNIAKSYDINYTDEQIKKIAQSKEFQTSFAEIMKGQKNETN